MGRPLSPESAYARSLGLTPHQMRTLGYERLKAMPEPQRAIVIGMSKRYSLNERLRKSRVRHAPAEE